MIRSASTTAPLSWMSSCALISALFPAWMRVLVQLRSSPSALPRPRLAATATPIPGPPLLSEAATPIELLLLLLVLVCVAVLACAVRLISLPLCSCTLLPALIWLPTMLSPASSSPRARSSTLPAPAMMEGAATRRCCSLRDSLLLLPAVMLTVTSVALPGSFFISLTEPATVNPAAVAAISRARSSFVLLLA